MDEELLGLAQKFLQESVYASREATHGFRLEPSDTGGQPGCGMGGRPVVPEEWSARQRALFEAMMQAAGDAALTEESVAECRGLIEQWLRTQDALDRKRNHFLKDFRHQHGFDQKSYPPDVSARFQAGIEAINEDNRARLADQARRLLSTFQAPEEGSPSGGEGR